MVTHDDISIQLPFTAMDGFKKSLLKSFSSFEVSEQILSIVATTYDVVNGTSKLHPLFSWHAKTTTLVPFQVNVNVLRLTPFDPPQAYIDFHAGKLIDYEYPDEEVAMALAGLPSFGNQ